MLTGAALARSLSFGWKLPAIGVHHLEGHLLAPMLESPAPPFPHVALLVSGGHTMLIEVRGQSRDHPTLLNVPETSYLKCVIAHVSL